MKYNRISAYAILLLVLCVFFIAFFCIVAFSSSYGYSSGSGSGVPTASTLSAKAETTIIIDAGHGGKDPGAIANNLIEKDINLSVAQKLESFLSLSGYNVIMTRNEDALLSSGQSDVNFKRDDLKQRLNIIEQTENCIFVSIHMNKFSESAAKGLQTFYSSNNIESQKLATVIQEYAKILDPENKREIKPDNGNIYILEHSQKPSVLIECGFLSNSDDAAKLKTEKYQQELAYVIFGGITKYLGGR
ncbi:MAG: N-acetylmuramoyl-L-alanine amidase [Clostridia bacterium]|nr:N-acetylmuramoyl-L-alanine amidase [Clostridia bacterium]MBQ7047736.1 N-acetylmuramoyl-L-alanine amidase [Clostridia bacterium]